MFSQTLADIRFGLGRSPLIAPPQNVDDILSKLVGFDYDGVDFPIPMFAAAYPSLFDIQNAGRLRTSAQKAGDEALLAQYIADLDRLGDVAAELGWQNWRASHARSVNGRDGFRERLMRFWSDHFTVRANQANVRHLIDPYMEEAIRPHVAGKFVDMLWAAATHPVMLLYLDQYKSVGPNSHIGKTQNRGLNENLARELLELHTVGVDAPYTQDDVRQLAELLTGLYYRPSEGMVYVDRMAEPGAETVLGVTYAAASDLSVVRDFIEDIAVHPSTAHHMATKLAVHFVSDTPDPDLVAAMEQRFNETGGDLLAVYEAMFAHPSAWDPQLHKVKIPFGFVCSSFRAMGVPAEFFMEMSVRNIRQKFERHLRVMGQDYRAPVGPDGIAEEAERWATPQGMAGRINWAMRVPSQLLDSLPDPRDLVHAALGEYATDEIVFAAGAAEDRAVGIGVILASAAFQRR